MLRIGKNPKDQSDNEHTNERQEAPSYTPQQPNASASPAPRADFTPTPVKAMTESENIAREIKEGTLSGFVGSGTELTGETTRWFDLKRTGRLVGPLSRVKKWNPAAAANIQDFHALRPIPNVEINANPSGSMKQNPGY